MSVEAKHLLPAKSASSIPKLGMGQVSAFVAAFTGLRSMITLYGVGGDFFATK